MCFIFFVLDVQGFGTVGRCNLKRSLQAEAGKYHQISISRFIYKTHNDHGT